MIANVSTFIVSSIKGNKMKIGVTPANIVMQSAVEIIGLAQLAESLGYESVWTFEHVIVPLDYDSKYP